MVTTTTNTERRDGVTLVTATVEGGPPATRVRLESHLDGPIWPPRRQGRPEDGWDDDGVEGVVPADGRLAVGFASPAEPVDPPLVVTEVQPMAEEGDAMDTPAAVVRGLGDPAPPSPIDGGADATVAAARTGARTGTGGDGADGGQRTDRSTDRSGAAPDRAPPARADPLPPAVADWLSAVEERVDRGVGLRAEASVAAATAALRDCGGVEGARGLDGRLANDVEALRAVERRAGALAERIEGTSVATRALDRLS